VARKLDRVSHDREPGVTVNRREWTPASIQHVSDLRAVIGEDGRQADDLASFSTEHVNGGVVLRISGEIDMLTAPRLREELGKLIDAHPKVLVLDLAAVVFFASSGLASLVEAREAAAAAGVPLRLACPSRSVRRPLQITGLAGRFETYDDVRSALKSAM
jgi:anti-sigma B factor antagonist